MCFFSTFLYWDCEALCPTYSTFDSAVCVSGATLKREPRFFGDKRRGGACGAYKITQRNNGNQTPAVLPILSLPPANKTVHQGKMFVQILIMYYSLETIFICSPSNTLRCALSATVVIFPFSSLCVRSYKSQETISFWCLVLRPPELLLLDNCCHVCVIELSNSSEWNRLKGNTRRQRRVWHR